MGDFRAILLEGVFYKNGVDLVCIGDKGKDSVGENLSSFVGQRVQIAAHHFPPNSSNMGAWGGGSCLWQTSGHCPAGHHERPSWLYNVSAEGLLQESESGWDVVVFGGATITLPFSHMLPGHHARVLVATVFSVEQMRDIVSTKGLDGVVDSVGDLQSVLSRLGGR